MAPVPVEQLLEWPSATSTTTALSISLALLTIGSLGLTAIACGCCGGGGKKEEAAEAGKDEGGGGAAKSVGLGGKSKSGAKDGDVKVSETTERKAPPKEGVTGGNRMYRTLMAVDDNDFLPSDKKEPTAAKKEAAAGGGAHYVEIGQEGASVKSDKKPTGKTSKKSISADKKKAFASARDPAYRSLMGLDDKFEPSARGK